jgi:rod shape-determining protein MreC
MRRVLLLGAFCLAVGLYIPWQSAAVEQVASYAVYPFLVIQQRCVNPIKQWLEYRSAVDDLKQQVAALQQEKEQLLTQVIRLQAGITYHDDSKELLSFKERYSAHNGILAQVLIRNFSEQSHFFIIDAGSSKGVTLDMVVVYKDHLVGRVTDVYPWYSKVLLITDRLCKVSAYCATTRANGIYVGTNNELATELTRVSHLTPVLEDDLILASGDGLVFPRGFALGRVKTCHTNGLFNTVTAEPLVDIKNLDYCFVIQKGGEILPEDHTAT